MSQYYPQSGPKKKPQKKQTQKPTTREHLAQRSCLREIIFYLHKFVTGQPFQLKEKSVTLSLQASCCPLQLRSDCFPFCFISAPLSGLKAGRSEAAGWIPLIFPPNTVCSKEFILCNTISLCWYFGWFSHEPTSSSNHKAAFPVSATKKLWPKR